MKMNSANLRTGLWAFSIVLATWTAQTAFAHSMHRIDGITGPAFTLTARTGYISTGDGNSLFIWGFANGTGTVQYPGPTLIVNQGDVVRVTLNNTLNTPVSILFPGQTEVAAEAGIPGLLTRQAAAKGGTVTYSFLAREPGTYLYNSGSQPDLQIEMGLVGALIIRPTNGLGGVIANQAYGHPDSTFDHEFLFLLTEMDEKIHDLVEQGRMAEIDLNTRWPVYWFINGRTGPDTMMMDAPWLTTQPYDCMPMFHPGQVVLMRMVGAGRDPHPFHHHGNHSRIIAQDGRLLQSAPGAGADLSHMVFTIPVIPGETTDALFSWTGEKLGWDIYGHSPTDPPAVGEYLPDHGKPMPAVLPFDQNLTFGQMYGGGPFLGTPQTLPPGQGGFNPNNGFAYMWHSHSEKEIVNNNIFPGGMMTMAIIEGR